MIDTLEMVTVLTQENLKRKSMARDDVDLEVLRVKPTCPLRIAYISRHFRLAKDLF